ncbi:outer membrane beta-barrel protein [candidate division KSB1 bacterium]|nr:outer membrane beta-barrel protein [candidate division KSB1 bacterium]
MNQMTSLLVLLPFITAAFPQDLKSQLSLNAGFSIPLGDFARQNDSETAGFAQFGFGAGAEYDLLIGDSGVAWSTSFHYITNDYQTEQPFKWIDDFQLEDTGAYSNFAFLTGLKYQRDIGDNFALFGLGQLGINLAHGPFFGGYIVEENDLHLVEVEMGDASASSFGCGVGFIANRTTTVSFRYFSLGSPLFSSTAHYTVGDERRAVDIEWKQPISMFLLTVGYTIHFND